MQYYMQSYVVIEAVKYFRNPNKGDKQHKTRTRICCGVFLFLFNFFFCMRADWTHTHTANCCNKRWLLLVLRQLCNAPRGGKVAESTIATATTTTTTQDTQITATTTNVSVAVFAQLFRYDCSIFVNVFFTLFFSVIRITQWQLWWSLELESGASCCWVVRPLFWGSLVTRFSYAIYERLSLFFAHTHTNVASRCGYVVALIALDAMIYAIYTIYLYIWHIFI